MNYYRTQLLLLLMAGDIHSNPGLTVKYPCPVCARDVTSRGVSYRCTICSGWVHAKCSGLLNVTTVSERNNDWTCNPCSPSKTQQSTPPPSSPSPTPVPSAEQISDGSTFNVLQFNANGICNQLTELGVLLERNKVNVAFIQESKLQNPRTLASGITPQYVRTSPMVTAEDYSTSFMNRFPSPINHSQQRRHLIPNWNNLQHKGGYREHEVDHFQHLHHPPASSGSNWYQSSIEHPLTTPDTLILSDFNAHHPSW